jgi:hypothetical protein
MHDRYVEGLERAKSGPESTVFAYKCKCGLSFTFEIKHGKERGKKPCATRRRRVSSWLNLASRFYW